MIYFLILFMLLTGILAFTSYNSMIKIESLEDYIETREAEVTGAIEIMTSIDVSGAFEADDEVGVVFKQLKEIVDELQKTYEE